VILQLQIQPRKLPQHVELQECQQQYTSTHRFSVLSDVMILWYYLLVNVFHTW